MIKPWFFKFIPIDEIQLDGYYKFFCVSRSWISPSVMGHMQYADEVMQDPSDRDGFHQITVDTLFGREEFRPMFHFQCPHCGVCYEAIVIEGGDKNGSSRENPAKQC